MKARCLLGTIALLVTSALAFSAQGPSFLAPFGPTVVVDGTMEESEWAAALTVDLSAQCTISFVQDGAFLYLGIRTAGRGFGSPCLVQSDSVRVLHASAALGTAIYERDGDAWILAHDFVSWSCRDTEFDDVELSREREAFLERHGWIASTGGMGASNEIEYTISWQEETVRLLVLCYDTGSFPRTIAWPDLQGTMGPYWRLLDGNLPATMPFSPETWAEIRAAPSPG